jgi:hypothetical protein
VVGAALANDANSPITLKAIADSGAVEVLADDIPNTDLASKLYWQLRESRITLRLLPSSCEILYRRSQPEIIAGLPTLASGSFTFRMGLSNQKNYRFYRGFFGCDSSITCIYCYCSINKIFFSRTGLSDRRGWVYRENPFLCGSFARW